MPTRTEHLRSVLTAQEATTFFDYFKQSVKWEEGIRSKLGFTRLAKALDIREDDKLAELIAIVGIRLRSVSRNYKDTKKIGFYGTYLNYYKDGTHWTPNHTHKGTTQIVVSLGGDRVLTVGKKEYIMKNGDVAIFGGSVHGVPKCENCEERISVAFFALKME